MSEDPIETARVPPDCEVVSPALQKSPPAVSVQVHPKSVHVPMSPQTIPPSVQNTVMSSHKTKEQEDGSLFFCVRSTVESTGWCYTYL